MAIYRVILKEIWYQPVEVEAKSITEAIQKAKSGRGTPIEDSFEYSHTLNDIDPAQVELVEQQE